MTYFTKSGHVGIQSLQVLFIVGHLWILNIHIFWFVHSWLDCCMLHYPSWTRSQIMYLLKE